MLITLLLSAASVYAQISTNIDSLRINGARYMSEGEYVDASVCFQTAMVLGDSSLTTLQVLKTCFYELKQNEAYERTSRLLEEIALRSHKSDIWKFNVNKIEDTISITRKDSLFALPYLKPDIIAGLLDSIHKIWAYAQHSLSRNQKVMSESTIFNLFSTEDHRIDSLLQISKDYYESKRKYLRRDIGLNANGNFTENFQASTIDMDRLPYRRKFSAGLDWNLLRDGLLDRKIDAKILSNEEEINDIQLRSQLPVSTISLLYERINALFAYQNMRVLELRAKLLSMKLPLAKELLARKQIPRIDLMKIEQQQTDVEGMLALYAAYGITLNDSIVKDSSMFDAIPNFNLDPLMIAASDSTLEEDYSRISHLTEENVRYNYHPIKSINIDVKTNYNLYDYDKSINAKRNFFNVALAASAPLSLLLQNKKTLIKNEAAMKTAQMEEQKMQISEEDRNTFYALKYKQKQYLNYFSKLNYYEELLRVQRVRNTYQDLNFKPLEALNEIDEYLALKIEQIDVLREMYLDLLKYFARHPKVNISDYAKTTASPGSEYGSDEPYTKSIYIWSSAYKNLSLAFITEYLTVNHFSNAIVSIPQQSSSRIIALQLIKDLQMQGKRVEVLIGDPGLLDEKDIKSRLASQLKGIDLSNVSALHLDVEPHTLSDWYTNRAALTAKYINVLHEAQSFCNSQQISLSVSIPLSFNDTILRAVYQSAQHVYLMAYEHKDVSYIQRKTAYMRSLAPDRTIICIRVKDFDSLHEMDSFTEQMVKTMNLSTVCIHGLSEMMMMERKN